MTLTQILVGGILGCVSGIVFLFGLEQKRHSEVKKEREETQRRLDECERIRNNTAQRVSVLETILKMRCPNPQCPLREMREERR